MLDAPRTRDLRVACSIFKAEMQAITLSKLPTNPFCDLLQPHQSRSARHAPPGDLEQVNPFIRRESGVLRQFEGLCAPIRGHVGGIIITANGDERGPAQPSALEQFRSFERSRSALVGIRSTQLHQMGEQALSVSHPQRKCGNIGRHLLGSIQNDLDKWPKKQAARGRRSNVSNTPENGRVEDSAGGHAHRARPSRTSAAQMLFTAAFSPAVCFYPFRNSFLRNTEHQGI